MKLQKASAASAGIRRQFGAAWVAAFLWLGGASPKFAQESDSVLQERDRKPFAVFDQVSDPVERRFLLSFYETESPRRRAKQAELFLATYPASFYLAQVHEIASKAYIDLGDFKRALSHGKASLTFLPENPLLLVPLANVQVKERMPAAGRKSAREALEYLDRIGRPTSVGRKAWPKLKRQLQASSLFALGRAAALEAIAGPQEERTVKWREAEDSLLRARSLNSEDPEIVYLLGLSSLGTGKIENAARQFGAVYRQKGALETRALEKLKRIYKANPNRHNQSFEAFLSSLDAGNPPVELKEEPPESSSTETRSAYAGSKTCRTCHAGLHEAWEQTGMARMFRPYRPENVLGDFERNNQFYAGDDIRWSGTGLEVKPAEGRSLFAQMEIKEGRHYFRIKHPDGSWRRYPVEYTIGSKWQQAYAVRMPSGQIHVFPIQYNVAEKRWINFWKIIDPPQTPRVDLRKWDGLSPYTSYEANCAVCHTSQLYNAKGGGFEPDHLNFREPGINCEMCHGPSAQHASAMLSGKTVKKDPLEPPVEFRKISSGDYVAVCAQCHMQSALREPGPEGELNYSQKGEAFFQRSKSRPFGEFSFKARYKDGRFRETTFIVESFLRSACFKKGGANCGHCHNPHPENASSNPNSLKFLDQPDRMCLQCHSAWKGKAEVHTRHPVESEASRCVSCHMPPIMNSVLLRAATHRIDDIPDPDMTLRFGQEESPNACLLCHQDKNAQWLKQQITLRLEGHSSP